MDLKRLAINSAISTLTTILSVQSLAAPNSAPSKTGAPSSPASSDAVVLAAHLLRPEVIDSCINEIRSSAYEFVWISVDKEEWRDPINVQFTMKANLIDRATRQSADKIAVMTVARDVDALQKGDLVFRCKLVYQAKATAK